MDAPVVLREAARIVLVDHDGRVLLIETCDPDRADRAWFWVTPGGGLEAGEDVRSGAVRELLEETGMELDSAALGPVRHERHVDFTFEGTSYRQHEVFFVVRDVAPFEPDTSRWEAAEVRSQRRVRWWTPQELAETDEPVYPEALAALAAPG